MTQIAWPELLRAGICQLGLRPEEFWRLTPAELTMMLGAGTAQVPLNRAGLDELARRFPDDKMEAKDDRR